MKRAKQDQLSDPSCDESMTKTLRGYIGCLNDIAGGALEARLRTEAEPEKVLDDDTAPWDAMSLDSEGQHGRQ